MLAYTAKNYVGFRKVTLYGDWEQGQLSRTEIEETDVTSICAYLSTDAFIRWEDTVSKVE